MHTKQTKGSAEATHHEQKNIFCGIDSRGAGKPAAVRGQ